MDPAGSLASVAAESVVRQLASRRHSSIATAGFIPGLICSDQGFVSEYDAFCDGSLGAFIDPALLLEILREQQGQIDNSEDQTDR